MNEETYLVTCSSGHETQVDLDEIEEILKLGTCPTEQCEAEVIAFDPPEIQIECLCCGFEEKCEWEDAAVWLVSTCPRCHKNSEGEGGGEISIVGTRYHEIMSYEYYCETRDITPYLRGNRGDYWDLVAHYTKRESFLKIMQEERIRAQPTGYFYAPAVCMTEAPVHFNQEFLSRYGQYGIVFRKGDVLRAGGGPAVYLLDSIIDAQLRCRGFNDEFKPFVNVIRLPEIAPPEKVKKRVDYLHDREWRFPTDVEFSKLEPFAIILPPESGLSKFLLEIAWKYQEIQQ